MKILLATNHLERLSGSEIVILEVFSFFVERGDSVVIFSNWKEAPIEPIFRSKGINIITDPDLIFPFQFDLVYMQHHVAALFSYEETEFDKLRTTFVFGRLSPVGLMEMGGWAHETALGDAAFANSEETKNALLKAGTSLPIHIFQNAAPRIFHRPPRALPDQPTNITLISNHRIPELSEFFQEIKGNVHTSRIGRAGDQITLVTPKIIQETDLVISIGKSVQYSLVGGTPIYVYDRFGGPGYLDESNFERAASFNFSGRCCLRKLSAQELVEDVFSGYPRGRSFAADQQLELSFRYDLDRHLDKMLELRPPQNDFRRQAILSKDPQLTREREISKYIRRSYLNNQNLTNKNQIMKHKLNKMKKNQ